MDATPPDKPDDPIDPVLAAQAHRARWILLGAMAVMILLPVLLFVIFHT
jgi:hypothetical protein